MTALHVLREFARLRLPVTAAAALATALALVQPFGITLAGDDGAAITGALVALGLVAEYLSEKLGRPTDGAQVDDAGIVSPAAATAPGDRRDTSPVDGAGATRRVAHDLGDEHDASPSAAHDASRRDRDATPETGSSPA